MSEKQECIWLKLTESTASDQLLLEYPNDLEAETRILSNTYSSFYREPCSQCTGSCYLLTEFPRALFLLSYAAPHHFEKMQLCKAEKFPVLHDVQD